MNVLIVSQYFWPESFRINDLAAGLVERGHHVTVFTGIPNYPGGKFFPGYGLFKNRRQNYKGVCIIRVPLISRGNGGKMRLALNYLSFVFFGCLLAPFYCREKYDVIFVYQLSPVTVGIPAAFLRKIKKIPMLFWIQDLWPESLSATGAVSARWILNGVSRIVRFIYRRCDRILIQSPAFARSVKDHGGDPEKIIFYPTSVEAVYQPRENLDRNIAQLLPSGFRLMFAGNIGAAQDFGTILSAMERLKGHSDIHLVVLGEGRMFAWVKEEVERRGLSANVHLLGRYPFETMPDFFAHADAMLVTLKKDPIFASTIPAKIQSYMACAKPIVAALDGEGRRLVCESGAGLASPSEDVEGLATLVMSMYEMNDGQRRAMGRCGRVYCDKHFEREYLLDRLETLMKDCVRQE